jgi:type II secretory pathway component PulF
MSKKRTLSPLERRINDWVAIHITTISFTDKVFFVDHLKTMVKAGLSIVEALDILAKEMANRKFQLQLAEVKEKVEKGQPLSEVLAQYPKLFPPIYVKMIAAGEISGKLETSLEQIVVQMKKTQQLISSVRGAMIYPAVVVTAMGAIGIMMATVVLPQLLVLFEDFDAELPLATRILISITDFISQPLNLILTFGVLGLIVAAWIYSLRQYIQFKRFVHNVNVHLPIFGSVIRTINLARFSLTLSSLMRSAIPIVDAVLITSQTCSNIMYREALTEVSKKIQDGSPLSQTLRAYDTIFPPMVTEMILVGERTGEVDHMLSELAEYYSFEVDKTMKNFSTIIEPVLILIMGAAVAGLALAVVTPMFNLVQNF